MQGALGSPGKLKGFCFYLWFVFQPRLGDATSWSSHQLETWAPSERLQSPGGELLHQPLKQNHGGRGRSGECLWKPERLVSLESLPPTLLHMHPCPWYSCRLIQLPVPAHPSARFEASEGGRGQESHRSVRVEGGLVAAGPLLFRHLGTSANQAPRTWLLPVPQCWDSLGPRNNQWVFLALRVCSVRTQVIPFH